MTFEASVFYWYRLFAAGACAIGIAGLFEVAEGLGFPLSMAIALASPGFIWTIYTLCDINFGRSKLSEDIFAAANSVALVVACAGALRIAETFRGPHMLFRIGYGVLAAAALVTAIRVAASALSWRIVSMSPHAFPWRAISYAAALLEYGTFSATAILISLRRNIERWTCVVVSLVSAAMFLMTTKTISFGGLNDDILQTRFIMPPMLLAGAAALWRMGVLLRSQSDARSTSSTGENHASNTH